MSNFFSMGGYGFYVWTSYALTLAIIVLNIWAPLRCERRLLGRIRRQTRRRKA